ncbi:MAG TPA: 2-dehydropantoate 2-reductase [Xanthobacteraceae bacterium]|jgi:2-dehydropantoate 2-reductase
MTGSSAPSARKTVAVIGLGSIGGIVAGCLRDADHHDVVICARQPIAHLTLERPDKTITTALRTLTDPDQATRVDWVLVCTKTQQTPSTAPWLARLCDSSTRVAVLQNGIGHDERLAPFAGSATVVPTIVYYNGERLAPDRVRIRPVGAQDLAVANDADGRDFVQLMQDTSLRIEPSDDFATLSWRKLLINAVANPVTALTSQRQAVFRREDIKALCVGILKEASAVGRAAGAKLDADEPAQIMARLLTYPPEAGTSMYFDRMGGRALEVEALTGAIVAAGKRFGIATPLNGALGALLRAVSDAAGK